MKVTAKICPGQARRVAKICASRVVRTLVLPVPAPASTRTGPSTASTASRCSAFRPFKYSGSRGTGGEVSPPKGGIQRIGIAVAIPAHGREIGWECMETIVERQTRESYCFVGSMTEISIPKPTWASPGNAG